MNFYIKAIFMVLVLVLVLGLASCQPADQNSSFYQDRLARLTDFEACHRDSRTQAAALVANSRCLVFEVPENPALPKGRQVSLQVLVLPARNTESLDDPVVILAGGPGQAATSLVAVGQIFSQVRNDRDIIFMDQRGTGELSPLQCDFESIEQADVALEQLLVLQKELLTSCLEKMQASPEFYTTDIAIKDLDAVRQYLGYEKFNLWGGSYGTRVALAYLQEYPETTRSVIIDGVAPATLALPLHMERDASIALQLIFDDCVAQPNCHQTYPELAEHFAQLSARLLTATMISVHDPIDNEQQDIRIDRDMLMTLLRAPLYGRETQRLIPYIIEQAYLGDFAPLFAGASALDAGINQAMYLSVICNEDRQQFSLKDLQAEKANDYLISSDVFSIPTLEACALWPKRQLPESYFEPLESAKPVLIFSGALDPVTPSVWGEQVHARLSNSEHVVVPGFAHSTFNSACTINMLNDFIEHAGFMELERDCLQQLKRRPFFISSGGAPAND